MIKPAPLALLAACLAVVPAARADDEYLLAWSSLDGGGGVLVGDGFELMGTIGQPDAGVLADAEYVLEGGFWVSPPAGGRVLCPADFNGDDFLDFFDYDSYLEAFETGIPTADFNRDGFIDFFDYDDFVGAFERGC